MSESTDHLIERKSDCFHKYITKNSEYVVAGDLCIEVRACDSLTVNAAHLAVRQRISALVRWTPNGGHEVLRGQSPKVGDSLFFAKGDEQLLTTVIRRIVSLSPTDKSIALGNS
jgi:hypothetical protein